MKHLSSLIASIALAYILASSTTAHAQNTITGGEFRVDGETFSFTLLGTTIIVNPVQDPVIPNAPVRSSEETIATASIDTTNLTIGPHFLETGFDADDGVTARMGPFIPQWFFVSGSKNITGAEWFIDTDPGEGDANSITLPNDGTWDGIEESITLSNLDSAGLSVGPHTFFIRSKDQDNLWSPASPAPFEIAPPLTIVAAEWVVDLSVLEGDGVPMDAKDGVFDSATEDVIWTGEDTTGLLPLGEHPTVYVRSRDSLGRWSYWQLPPGEDPPQEASQVLNRPPAFNPSIADQVVIAGDLLELTVAISDPDGDAVTVGAPTLPSGATYNAATGLFQWTPTPAQVGMHQASFSVSDDFTPPLSGALAFSIDVQFDTEVIQVTPLNGTDFGSFEVGNTGTLTFSITNIGAPGTMLTGVASIALPFSITSGASYSLAQNASQNITVQFTPTTSGVVNGALSFTGGGDAQIALTGEGTTTPVLDVQPIAGIDFGQVQIGTSATQLFNVRNAGTGILVGTATTRFPFSITSGQDYALNSGQNQVVEVRFTPIDEQAYSDTVDFTGGAGASSPVTGAGSTQPSGGEAIIGLSPAAIDFGTIDVGMSADRTVTVSNTGDAQLDGSVNAFAPFSIVSGSPYSVAPAASSEITIRFSPLSGGQVMNSLLFTGGGGGLVSVTGTAPPEGPGPGDPRTPCDTQAQTLFNQLQSLRSIHNLDDDIDDDGLPEEFLVNLILEVACGAQASKSPPRSDLVAEAFEANLAVIEAEGTGGDNTEVIAMIAMSSTPLRDFIASIIGFVGRENELAVISCENGECVTDGTLPNEVFSGGGDIDDDGVSNAQELQDIVASGGSIEDALDALLIAREPPATGCGASPLHPAGKISDKLGDLIVLLAVAGTLMITRRRSFRYRRATSR